MKNVYILLAGFFLFLKCDQGDAFYYNETKLPKQTFYAENDQLLINEIVTATNSDWVELAFKSPQDKGIEISSLFVTMYYGENESLSVEPVTIYNFDRSETDYDDRFILVHLTEPEQTDETDSTGDTNQNGYLDLYCNNYYNSLWNSDGVIAIDTDDDPSNGGIIDFIAYSNQDDSPNETIVSFCLAAQELNFWEHSSEKKFQAIAIPLGLNGLEDFMSLSRQNLQDTNSAQDFSLSRYQTPGQENIINLNQEGNLLFKLLTNLITISLSKNNTSKFKGIPLFVYEKSNLKLSLFSSSGLLLYQSDPVEDVFPGKFFFPAYFLKKKIKITNGLYPLKIEATVSKKKLAESHSLYLLIQP